MTADADEVWLYVTGGTWLYDGAVAERVEVYRSRRDLKYEALLEDVEAGYAELEG